MPIGAPAALRVPIFRATARKTPERPCTNCGDPMPGNYCRMCGQRKVEVKVSLARMTMEVLDDQFSINSALPRTLGSLLFRPGHLTREYMSGRIARYIPPFRLYLVASVAFFVALSMLPELRDPLANTTITRETTITMGRGGETPEPPAAPGVAAVAPGQQAASADSAAAVRPAQERRPAVARGLEPRVPVAPPLPPAAARASFLDGVEFRTGNVQLDSVMNERLDYLRGLEPRESARQLIGGYLDHVPQMMFMMLPLFAALLKLLYARSGRYYVEHFVFALHLHAFAFISYLVMIVVRWPPLLTILSLWMFVYLFAAMKRVYRQGWFVTATKYALLGVTYFVLVSIAAMLTFVATVLTV